MKKTLLLAILICCLAISHAQNVTESIIPFGKDQISGYLIDIPNADVKLADAAFRTLLEQKYNLKASKESGFRAYINQNLLPIGPDNYDLYFTVSEYGKKNKTTQISFIVCSGNLNPVTSLNNPQAAENIKTFLKNFVNYVDEFSNNQKMNEISEKIKKLEQEKSSLEKSQEKIGKQIEKLNKDIDKNNSKITDTDKKITELKEKLNLIKK